MDKKANTAMEIGLFSAIIGGLRASLASIKHLMTTMNSDRKWKIKNMWIEHYNDLVKKAVMEKTKRMNHTEK